MTAYLALVKVPANATAEEIVRLVPDDLTMLADRLVTEYGQSAQTVERWFEAAIDVSYDAEQSR